MLYLCVHLFITFSRAVSRYMGAAMTRLAWMSSAVLYWVVARFLARPVKRKRYSTEPEDSVRPLFKAIVYSRSSVRENVNTTCRYTSVQRKLSVRLFYALQSSSCAHESGTGTDKFAKESIRREWKVIHPASTSSRTFATGRKVYKSSVDELCRNTLIFNLLRKKVS